MFFSNLYKGWEWGDVSVHTEYSISNYDATPVVGSFLDFLEQIICIGMSVAYNSGFAKSACINNTCMIELVRKNNIFFANEGRDNGKVRHKATLESNYCFCLFEFSKGFF